MVQPEVIFGDPRLSDSFWDRATPIADASVIPGPCWLWTGYVNKAGYAQTVSAQHGTRLGHIVSRISLLGLYPRQLDLDHLCRNRSCVYPHHTEPATRRENLIRGETKIAVQVAQTHCIHGHEFNLENTGKASNGSRVCKACRREWGNARYAKDPDRFAREARERRAREGA